ncbi:hypothetical protein BDQ17DRAFT_1426767 [Cyathus striatus]|nr:hypothetical protein BDQ17DRAFT_1426767 [Cyathus striatus]
MHPSDSNSATNDISRLIKQQAYMLGTLCSSEQGDHPKKPNSHSKHQAAVISNIPPTSPTRTKNSSSTGVDHSRTSRSSSSVENPSNENSSSQAPEVAVANDTGSLIPSDNYPNGSAQEDDKKHLSNIIRV